MRWRCNSLPSRSSATKSIFVPPKSTPMRMRLSCAAGMVRVPSPEAEIFSRAASYGKFPRFWDARSGSGRRIGVQESGQGRGDLRSNSLEVLIGGVRMPLESGHGSVGGHGDDRPRPPVLALRSGVAGERVARAREGVCTAAPEA